MRHVLSFVIVEHTLTYDNNTMTNHSEYILG